MEQDFNTGRFRGALFHLNFQANERQRYMKKIKNNKTKNVVLRQSEEEGKLFAQGSHSIP